MPSKAPRLAANTHDSQCAKNKLSLLIFLELNQAEVMVTAMRVAAILTGVTYSSPGCKPTTRRSVSHEPNDAMVERR